MANNYKIFRCTNHVRTYFFSSLRMSKWLVNISGSTEIKYTMVRKMRQNKVDTPLSHSQKWIILDHKEFDKYLCLSWTSCSSTTPFCSSSLAFDSGEKNWVEIRAVVGINKKCCWLFILLLKYCNSYLIILNCQLNFQIQFTWCIEMNTIEIPIKKFIVNLCPNSTADAMPVKIVATVEEYFFKIVSATH